MRRAGWTRAMTKRDDESPRDDSLGCDRARHLIASTERSPADELALGEHLRYCPACACLAADGGALALRLSRASSTKEVDEADLAPVLAGLERSLTAEQSLAGRLRSLSTRVRALLAAIAASLIVLVAGLLPLRPDLSVYPPLRLSLELGLVAAMATGAAWLWLRPLFRSPLRRWIAPSIAASSLVLPWLIAAAPAAHRAHPASLAGTGDDLVARALACLLYGGVWGALLALGSRAIGRTPTAPPRLRVFGAVAGALVGLLSLQLHCPLTSPVHLLAGHAPVPMLLVVLFALLPAWARAGGSGVRQQSG